MQYFVFGKDWYSLLTKQMTNTGYAVTFYHTYRYSNWGNPLNTVKGSESKLLLLIDLVPIAKVKYEIFYDVSIEG